MPFDIYGGYLRPGHCEVHPHVHEHYPCSVCYEEDRHYEEQKRLHDEAQQQWYEEFMGEQEEEYYKAMQEEHEEFLAEQQGK